MMVDFGIRSTFHFRENSMNTFDKDWLLAKTFIADWWRKNKKETSHREVKRERKGYQGAKPPSNSIEQTDEGMFYTVNWADGTKDRIKLRGN